MNEFISWAVLGTYGGALAMVMVLTQFTKDLPFTKKVPTQLWSYVLSLIVLFPAMIFTSEFTVDIAIQTLFNGVIVSMAANGGYGIVQKITQKKV